MDAKRRQRPKVLCLRERWCQKFDQCFAAGLLPTPDLAGIQRGDGFEREILQHVFERFRDRIAKRDRQALEARNIARAGRLRPAVPIDRDHLYRMIATRLWTGVREAVG